MEKGGWGIPIVNLGLASLKVLQGCSAVDSRRPAKFLEEPGEWAIMGYILHENADMRLSEIFYGKGTRAVAAAGDENAIDLDLSLTQDNANGRLVASDTDPDANPFVAFESARDDTHSLRISNVQSKGATLVMIAQLAFD